MKKMMLILAVSICGFQGHAQSQVFTNGTVQAVDEFVGPESEQVHVRIFGGAARILCSSVGMNLEQYSGKSFVGSKGSITCLTTSNKDEYIAGMIVSSAGETKNLEEDGYQ